MQAGEPDALAAGGRLIMALPYTRAEVKDRARSEWVGLCNVTLPSFYEDFPGLNERGIRHDVELAARYGYWGTLVGVRERNDPR